MPDNNDENHGDESGLLNKVKRRGFLAGLGATATAGAAIGGSNAMPVGGPEDDGDGDEADGGGNKRLTRAYRRREKAARDLLRKDTGGTGVIGRFDKLHGTYTKGLPHNDFGEVDVDAYEVMDEALGTTDISKYNEIPLAQERKLANPIGAQAFNLVGADGHQKPMPKAPAVGSDETAAEMVELYWRALLRDVPFEEYDNSELAQAALDELSSLDGYKGPTDGSPGEVLFRTSYEGDQQGPFISQFLLQDIPFSAMTIKNELNPQVQEDFMTDEESFLNVRRGDGEVVGTEEFMDEKRRITNGRDLLTHVHRNIPVQTAINAAYYLLVNGFPMEESIETRNLKTQNQFLEFGPPLVTTIVNGIVDNVKHGTWYHKWNVHRRARPEKYGGLVHFHKKSLEVGRGNAGKEEEEGEGRYPFLNKDLLESEAVRRTKEKYDSWFLPQGYPEGSPTHPSYPAGHSVFIGAAVTVLKALFDGDATLDRTIRVDGDGEVEETDEELTVRGELHKVASNHAFGRDFSGIHYRTDGTNGHVLGEKMALEYLQDNLLCTATDAKLSLKGFNGDDITVTEDEIRRE